MFPCSPQMGENAGLWSGTMNIIELTGLDDGVVYVNGEHIAATRADLRNHDTVLELLSGTELRVKEQSQEGARLLGHGLGNGLDPRPQAIGEPQAVMAILSQPQPTSWSFDDTQVAKCAGSSFGSCDRTSLDKLHGHGRREENPRIRHQVGYVMVILVGIVAMVGLGLVLVF